VPAPGEYGPGGFCSFLPARAVIAYYKGKRDHYVAKAQGWTDKANAVAARYKEGRA